MFGFSKEQSSFQLRNKCPLCSAWLILTFPHYITPDGRRVSPPVFLPRLDRRTVAECPKCNQRWPVFAATQSKISQPDYKASFIETNRTEESIGEEQRAIDNSHSSISLTRRFTVSKEWFQSYTIEYEKAQSEKQQINFGLAQTVNIQTMAENSIKEYYSLSSGAKQTYTEEITLNVPAKTKLSVVFHWKRIWQQGILTIRIKTGQVFELPFQLAIGITFDQTQIDET